MDGSAGYRELRIADPAGGLIGIRVLYPSTEPERPVTIGGYVLDVAPDGDPAPGRFGLVVLSHGSGGTGLVYRTTALALARRDFVVALADHPGDRLGDARASRTAANLAARPRHLRAVVDELLANPPFAATIDAGRVAVVGHSMGGYTALAAAGASAFASARETPDGRPAPIPACTDPRIGALVLLAPATAWFAHDGAFDAVRIPTLLLTAEHDVLTPAWQAEIVRRGIPPALLEAHVVAGAGHYSFLSPFPPERRAAAFAPAHDPPGFDRAAFNGALNATIATFLHRVLPAARPRG